MTDQGPNTESYSWMDREPAHVFTAPDPLNLCNECDYLEATTPAGYCADCDPEGAGITDPCDMCDSESLPHQRSIHVTECCGIEFDLATSVGREEWREHRTPKSEVTA